MKFLKIPQIQLKSPLSILAFRLAILMIIFSVIRAAFYLMNIGLFPDINSKQLFIMFFAGLRFDLTAILYFNSLYILAMLLPLKARHHSKYIKSTDILFAITNSLAVLMNLADIIYYRFTNRRSSFMILDEFANETNYFQLLYHFIIDYFCTFTIQSINQSLNRSFITRNN